jgi:hypothetical protein
MARARMVDPLVKGTQAKEGRLCFLTVLVAWGRTSSARPNPPTVYKVGTRLPEPGFLFLGSSTIVSGRPLRAHFECSFSLSSFYFLCGNIVMQDRSPQVLAVGLFFAILAWLSVGLRVYIRAVMQRSFALDDWLIVLTLVGSTTLASLDSTKKYSYSSPRTWSVKSEESYTVLESAWRIYNQNQRSQLSMCVEEFNLPGSTYLRIPSFGGIVSCSISCQALCLRYPLVSSSSEWLPIEFTFGSYS